MDETFCSNTKKWSKRPNRIYGPSLRKPFEKHKKYWKMVSHQQICLAGGTRPLESTVAGLGKKKKKSKSTLDGNEARTHNLLNSTVAGLGKKRRKRKRKKKDEKHIRRIMGLEPITS